MEQECGDSHPIQLLSLVAASGVWNTAPFAAHLVLDVVGFTIFAVDSTIQSIVSSYRYDLHIPMSILRLSPDEHVV